MQLRSRLCTASRLDTASGRDTTSRLFNLFAAGSFAAAHQTTKLSFENAATLSAGRLFNTAGRLFNTAGRFDTAGRLFADNLFAAIVLVEHAVKFVLQHFHFANLKSTAWICATDRLTTTTN